MRFVTGILAVVWVAFATPCSASVEPHASRPRALDDAYVRFAMEADPLFADQLGVHAYDDRLDDYSAVGHARRLTNLRRWRSRLRTALTVDSSLDDRADTQTLLDAIELELFEDSTTQPFHRDPTAYVGTIGQAAYALVGRHYASPDARLRHLAPRLRRIPAIVAAAEANLTRPPRVFTLQAIDQNAGNADLYASLPEAASGASPATRAAIARALPPALAAIRAFSTYLKRTLLPRSDGEPRVGARVFDRELRLADGTSRSRADLLAGARAEFRANRARMLRLALPYDRTFFPGRRDERGPHAADVVVRRVLDRLADDHPTRDAIFRTAKRDVDDNERFLAAHPLVALPQPDSLRIAPTPAFMAGFSGASLDPAGPFTPLAESYYYIDTIPATWTAAHVASYLRDYNDYELRMLSIHEAVPGHYVQFRINDGVPSLVRRTFANGSFVEGWAVYGEGLMLDGGFGGGDTRLRLFQLKWRLREEANTVVDIGYHTGGLTRAAALDLLERGAYQDAAQAEGKWHRLELSHDQLTSYYIGLDAIRRARDAERRRLGALFDIAAFDAKLLAMGSIEPRFIDSFLRAAVRRTTRRVRERLLGVPPSHVRRRSL